MREISEDFSGEPRASVTDAVVCGVSVYHQPQLRPETLPANVFKLTTVQFQQSVD